MSNERIFFYCSGLGPPKRSRYQHQSVCLAEGLKELGVGFSANIDYWKTSATSDEFLFTRDPQVGPDDCTVVVVNHAGISYGDPLPERLFRRGRRYVTVFLDASDGLVTPTWDRDYRQFDVILKSHFNDRFAYPANVRPWAFGLSRRILKATSPTIPFEERKRCILRNYRAMHGVRKWADRHVLPRLSGILAINATVDPSQRAGFAPDDKLMWHQTGRRHLQDYYKRLREAMACSCFCGNFVAPYPLDQARRKTMADRVRSLSQRGGGYRRISQWDSWRHWEAFAAGVLVVTTDYENHGARLPVMPRNGKDYVGIDVDDIPAAIAVLKKGPQSLETMAGSGRAWALTNYAPAPTASRFLETIAQVRAGS